MRPLLTVLVLCALVVSACGRTTKGKTGAELYEVSCAGCHGSVGEGNILGPAIGTPDSPSALDLDDEQIFGAIRVGPGSMPGNPLLTDSQINSLVELVRALQTAP
jgi:mono/diheme cytochrome c family protein